MLLVHAHLFRENHTSVLMTLAGACTSQTAATSRAVQVYGGGRTEGSQSEHGAAQGTPGYLVASSFISVVCLLGVSSVLRSFCCPAGLC